MDKLAKTLAIRSFGQVVSIPSAVPLLGMSKVMVKGSLVVSTFQKSLAYGIHHSDMVEYIADKWEIDAYLLQDTVAWPSIAKARKSAGAISHRARVVVGRVLSVRGGMLPRHLFRFEFRISNSKFKIQKFTARTWLPVAS